MNKYSKQILNAIIIVLLILFFKFIYYYIKIEKEQRQIKIAKIIVEEKNYAYKLLKENSPLLDEYVIKISKLEKTSPDIIKKNLIEKLEKEKELNFKKEKAQLIKDLIEAYNKNNMSIFEELKNKNLEKYFENNIELFKRDVEAQMDFKIFTNKELPYPQTQILYNDLFKSDQDGCIYIASYNAPLYLKLNYTGNKQILTAFIRQNEFIEIPLFPGKYQMNFIQGFHWFGEENNFYPKTYEGSSSKDMVIDLGTKLYFDNSSFTQGFVLTNQNSFWKTYNLISERIKRELDPNYNLHIKSKSFEEALDSLDINKNSKF